MIPLPGSLGQLGVTSKFASPSSRNPRVGRLQDGTATPARADAPNHADFALNGVVRVFILPDDNDPGERWPGWSGGVTLHHPAHEPDWPDENMGRCPLRSAPGTRPA